ncbi:hypothetical protein QFZ89_007932 [Paraburkholderia youngii]
MPIGHSANVGIPAFPARRYCQWLAKASCISSKAAPSQGWLFLFSDPIPMSELLEPPVVHASTPFDPAGKTINQVARHIGRILCRFELEPVWIIAANVANDPNEDWYGLAGSRDWPDGLSARRRLVLSIAHVNSEGWIIQVDLIQFVELGEAGHWKSQPVLRVKTRSRTQAWATAAVVSRMLALD